MKFNLKTGAAAVAALTLSALAAPAFAATTLTFNYNSAGATTSPVIANSGTAQLAATAWRVNPGVTDLTGLSNLSQLSSLGASVTQQASGLGVAGGANFQLDTNGLNRQEALLFTANTAFHITGLKLGVIDSNDTLQLYGVKLDGSLVNLGFGGVIVSGLGGSATFSNSGQTTTLTLNQPTGLYNRYLFTTSARGDVIFGGDTGQGYTVGQISGMVPEPGTWAMMIGGFGLAGFALRRRSALAAA